MATIGDVLDAFAYYIGHGGYYEKKNGTEKYLTRAVDNFQANKGSANWTYMGKLCGVNPGAWCAMMVSTAVHDGCGFSKAAARTAMWGVWPYTACNQLWDAAPAGKRHWSYYQLHSKGRSGSDYAPQVGDVIIFSDNGTTRTHTGMVYAADGSYVYTYEGNSGNMARRRSYSLKSSYIYGYVTLNLEDGDDPEDTDSIKHIKAFQKWLGVSQDGEYGPVTKKAAIKAHQKWLNSKYKSGLVVDGEWGPNTYYATQSVQKGDTNNDVLIWQGLLYCLGYDPVGLDGDFGANTEKATVALQAARGLNTTGIADRYTWAKALGYGRPAHSTVKYGSKGSEVSYLQRRLTNAGYPVVVDGEFGKKTESAVLSFQKDNGLVADGIVGVRTWEKLD